MKTNFIKTAIITITLTFTILLNATAQAPDIEWQRALGGTDYDWASSIQQTSDGGYIVAGYSSSTDGDVTGNHDSTDFWVVKLNSVGTIQWQKALGGTDYDWASSIQQTSDGGYIVAGWSESTDGDVTGNHGYIDCWVVKLNSNGNIQWQKALGGTERDFAYSIQQTADGGYIVAGFTTSTDGDVTGNHGDYDAWVVKLKAGSTGISESFTGSSFSIPPNPATDRVRFPVESDVQLHSLTGQFITEAKNTRSLDITGLPAGMYFIALTNSNGQIIQRDKIVKQ